MFRNRFRMLALHLRTINNSSEGSGGDNGDEVKNGEDGKSREKSSPCVGQPGLPDRPSPGS